MTLCGASAALVNLYLKVELVSCYCNKRGFTVFGVCYVNLGSPPSAFWARCVSAKVAVPAVGGIT